MILHRGSAGRAAGAFPQGAAAGITPPMPRGHTSAGAANGRGICTQIFWLTEKVHELHGDGAPMHFPIKGFPMQAVRIWPVLTLGMMVTSA
jgi:hypothetical protein